MKKLIFIIAVSLTSSFKAQVLTPKASPIAKIQQNVGLADIIIEYSRPSVNGRVIFGELIPYGKMWRLGANQNTIFSTNQNLFFGKDTLYTGSYALFAKPGENNWEFYFYKDYSNWGLPEKWDDSKVALKVSASAQINKNWTENLTLQFDELRYSSAKLTLCWAETKVELPFGLDTKSEVLESIDKTMSGPAANDYHKAATYYFNENLDLKQALEWSTKAVELRGPSAYWMTRLKAQLQAANGDYKGAIETAKISMDAAKADGDDAYVSANQKSIDEWSKKR